MKQVESGDAARSTELGRVMEKVIACFEQMDLPESINDARMVVFLDAQGANEHVVAGSEGYSTETPEQQQETFTDLLVNLLEHARALAAGAGIDLELMGPEELRERSVGGQN